MKVKRSSNTAGYTCAMRAIANLAPRSEKYLDDPYSLEFLPFPWFLTKPLFLMKLFHPITYQLGLKAPEKLVGFSGMTALACLRHRYIDDQIMLAYKQGIRRFILLGAGYDTRSLRLHTPEAVMVEVDHPDTQRRKRHVLEKKHLQPTCRLEFVSLDFSQPWSEALFSQPYMIETARQPTMVIWEGVSCYLLEDDVLNTFNTVYRLLQGGGVFVFDAFSAELLKPDTHIDILQKMRGFVELKGEPFYWAEDESPIKEAMSSYGFKQVDAISIYDIATDLSEKESLQIPKDKILKYLSMYICRV